MTPKKKLSEPVNLLESKKADTTAKSLEIPVTLNPEDFKRLLQELQLKDIELELKNEELNKSNVELEKQLKNYSLFFQNSPIAYFIIQQDGIIKDVNFAGAELFKSSIEELKNISILNFITHDSREIFNILLLTALLKRAQYSYVNLVNTLNEEISARVEINTQTEENLYYITFFPNANSEKEKIIAKFNEKEIIKHEHLYKALGESLDYGIWVCDPEGHNLYSSDSFLKFVGLTQEQCSDFGWIEVLHPDDKENTFSAWKESVKYGTKLSIEHRFKGADGNWHYILSIGIPVKNNESEVFYWVGINLDADKQKQTELELIESKKREQERVIELETDITIRKEWEKAITESENNFKNAENIAHMGSFQHDLLTGYCAWSDELFRICGYEPQTFIPDRENFMSVFHPEDREGVETAINDAIKNISGYKHNCRILCENGEIKYAISIGKVITNDKFEPVEIKGALLDVTDLKKIELSLQESEDNYRKLFESMPVGLAVSDSGGNIIYGNKKSRILLGISCTELKRGDIDISRWKFVNKDGSEIVKNDLPNMKAMRDNVTIENSEIGIIKENNQLTWLNVTAAPLQNQDELKILLAFIDISEQIEREKQLRLLSEKLKELNATKDKFFSIIAHDLKNPFNSILGFSELLLKNIEKYSSEEIERFINIINNTSQNAYILLENLLNWSRSQTGNIEFNPFSYNLTEIINTNLDFVENFALKKNIKIYFDPTGIHMVRIDKNMIDTVLRNLLTNSIKFSYPGGKILITIESEGVFYKVSVKDNGMGIEEENIEKLFRIESKYSSYGTNQEKGSGLGLIISKEFIELNKGRIWANSEFGKGSEFIFTLPKA